MYAACDGASAFIATPLSCRPGSSTPCAGTSDQGVLLGDRAIVPRAIIHFRKVSLENEKPASLPIARAVAASNGFPVLFGPITLRNYRDPDCRLPLPLPPRAWEGARGDLRRRALIENLYRYADVRQTPWIHLMDGGISDNLALRVLLNDMLLLDINTDRFAAGLLPVRRILIISVDGQSTPNPSWPHQRVVSGLGQIISAVTSAQIGAYNIETLIAVETAVDDLVNMIARDAGEIAAFLTPGPSTELASRERTR